MLSNTMFETVIETIVAAKAELLLFCLAIAMHHFIFGAYAIRRKGTKPGKLPSKVACSDGSPREGFRSWQSRQPSVSAQAECRQAPESMRLAATVNRLDKTVLNDKTKHIASIRACVQAGNVADVVNRIESLQGSTASSTNALWNAALDAFVERNNFAKAEQLMRQQVAIGAADTVSYNTMIKALLNSGDTDRARRVMGEMRRAGFAPNQVTYNELVNALVRSRKPVGRIWEIIDEMVQDNVSPNHVTCSILLKSLHAKSPHDVIARTMELTKAVTDPMDEVLLSSAVEACVRIGNTSLLEEQLKAHKNRAIPVAGVHTFGSLIKGYGYIKDTTGAWQCWKELRSQHLRPTSITIGCMVEAIASNGDVDGAYELIHGLMDDDNCKDQVNAIIFGSVLKGYSRARRMERVWAVFQEMLERNVQPTVSTYNAVIDACVKNDRAEQAPKLIESMKERGIEPNVITYSTLIKGFCNSRDVQAALAAFDDMQRSHVQADEIVYNTLLEGCCNSNLRREGENVFKRMQADGIGITNYTLTFLLKLAGSARDVNRALELYEDIPKRHCFQANGYVCAALVQTCISCRHPERAVPAVLQAMQDQVNMDSRTIAGLARSLLPGGHATSVANVLLTALRSRHYCSAVDEGMVSDVLSMLRSKGGDHAAVGTSLAEAFQIAQPNIICAAQTRVPQRRPYQESRHHAYAPRR